jgi:hypothetical protein
MAPLTIKLGQEIVETTCGLCGTRTPPTPGPCLARADGPSVVCRECGKKHAPGLVALLDLARVAERAGRVGRHTVVPPMTVMMDLVQAAEAYTYSTAFRGRRAA